MELKDNIDIKKNCRVCLLTYEDMQDIYSKENEYEVMLKECGRINIEENDGLPEVICSYCAEGLLQTHHFIIKCQHSDKKLRSILSVKLEDTKDEDNYLFNDDGDIKYDDDEDNIPLAYVKEEPIESSDIIASHFKAEIENTPVKISKRKVYNNENFPKKCSECSYVAKCKSLMIIHNRTHTNEKPFLCSLCGKCFKINDSLKAHFLRKHSTNKEHLNYKCDTCEKRFYKKKDLTIHIRTHTGETPHQCKFCPKKFSQLSSLTRHTRTHTGARPYKCHICSKSFSSSSVRTTHMAVHNDERKFACNECGAMFKTKQTRDFHTNIHTNSREVVCDQCGLRLRNTSKLTLHRKRVHSESSGQCHLCMKTFSKLNEHLILHSSAMPFSCHLCDKKFNRKSSLHLHITKHNNAKKFSCPHENCNKTFPSQNMQMFHELKYHKKETPFTCKHCKKGFYRISDLNRHIKVYHAT